eukprot:NODE_281_length_10828_cov_0.749837.p7 type:complete len:146 gc:universal NODE_281_length_10828_cov_0.749837:4421-4858(+)
MNHMSHMNHNQMKSSKQSLNQNEPTADPISSPMGSMGAMGTSFNFNISNFSILFENWQINSIPQFIGSLFLLFLISFASESLIRYKPSQNRYLKAIRLTIRSFISALLMLAMMTFNGFIILSIVCGSGLAYFIFPMQETDMVICA